MTASARLRGREFIELFAAFGFAIAQPILSVFGKSPDTFIYRRADRVDIVVFALVVALAIPTFLWLVECAIALWSSRAARVTHLFSLAALALLWAIQIVANTSDLRGAVLLVAAALAAVAFVLAYLRFPPVRTFLGFLAVAPVLFVLMFLVASPTADLLTPATVTARAEGHQGKAPSVVLVVFDEWPTSSVMDATGRISTAFPHLRELAGTSTWYRNSSSVSNSTPYAVPAILTGSLPRPASPTAATYPRSLFNAFGKNYRLEVSESVTSLCAAAECRSATSGAVLPSLITDARETFGRIVSLDRTHRDPTTSFVERVQQLGNALGQRSVRFDNFLAGFHRDDTPAIHVLHILLPHVPYRFLPSGVEYAAPSADGSRTSDLWGTDPVPVAFAHQRLLLQVGFVDGLIGQLVDRLHATHQFDSSIVAVTADHGITFAPGRPARGLSAAPIPTGDLPDMLDAPLVIKAPGQTKPVVSDANVMSIDVLPTLAKLAGVRLPWPVGGVVAGDRTSNEKLFARESSDRGAGTLSPIRRYRADDALRTLLANDDVDSLTEGPDGPFRLFNPAGLGGLVGRRVASLDQGAPSSATMTLAQADALRSGARSAAKLPAMISGFTQNNTVIAVALNGTVAGVAPTVALGGTRVFVAMVPDALIRDRNAVSLYEVTGLPGSPVLHPMS